MHTIHTWPHSMWDHPPVPHELAQRACVCMCMSGRRAIAFPACAGTAAGLLRRQAPLLLLLLIRPAMRHPDRAGRAELQQHVAQRRQ